MSKRQLISLVHLGCARNLIDSELILGRLAGEGLIVSGDPEQADTVVLNTCSFIGPAREESETQIRRLIRRKQRGEIERVVVAGCLVQRFQHELEKRFPQVDLFAEISDGKGLAAAIRELGEGKAVPRYLASAMREAGRDEARMLSTPRSFAYLRISHGCDHTCSFCAIPAIRGKHRSKRPDDVLAEARELIDAGVRELVLVAEDSTAWGRDMGLELPDLVEALAELEGEHRLRVMYAYPNRFPWRMTELLRDHPRVERYLDIPVQHIATPILRSMRRAGSGDQVRELFDRLLEEVPGLTLRTTLLVGFPGETEEHVDELVQFVERYRLGRIGAFTYSPEQGTPGFELEATVTPKQAKARHRRVLAARDRVLAATQKERVGSEIEVLIDQPASSQARSGQKSGGAPAVGRTASDAPEVDLLAYVERCKAEAGERVRVRVEGVDRESNLICGPQARR